jgi:hypothetical protein
MFRVHFYVKTSKMKIRYPWVYQREFIFMMGGLLLLLQTIYGLKQAARAFFDEAENTLDCMDYEQDNDDPCLFCSWTMVEYLGLYGWMTLLYLEKLQV